MTDRSFLSNISSSTDIEWEKWGSQDPYFGVLTDPKYRSVNITTDAKEEFFLLGQLHCDHLLMVCRSYIDPTFSPARVLDFGCGVGRVAIPFVKHGFQVVGVDISPSMLAEARKNCEASGISSGIDLVTSDDSLSLVHGDFDLVHSCIVIQHIEIERGLKIFQELVKRIRTGGIGAIHVTFAYDLYNSNLGVKPAVIPGPPPSWWRQLLKNILATRRISANSGKSNFRSDPEMQMNLYDLNKLMYLLHQVGIAKVYTEITNHGGVIGAFLYFQRAG